MPIVEDYTAIAKRLRELQALAAENAGETTERQQGRDLAQTVRQYIRRHRTLVEDRRLPRR